LGKKLSKKDKDGGYSSYYDVPKWIKDAVGLLEHKDMNHSVGEAFLALYRLHDKDTPIRNLEKVMYYADREIKRLKRKEKKKAKKKKSKK